jgi:hypothetical protein
MSDTFTYLGREVIKAGFRAFIYKHDLKKLVNSFEEYEAHKATGEWFDSEEDARFKPSPIVKDTESFMNKSRKKGA